MLPSYNKIYQYSKMFNILAKDESGQVRHFPGPHGDFISPNYDLGSGPYSQNNGKPYGGLTAKQFINKKRSKKKKKSNALLTNCSIFNKIAMMENNQLLSMLTKSTDTFIDLIIEAIKNKDSKIKHSEFAKDRFVLKISDDNKFFSGVDIQDEDDTLMVLTFRPGSELSVNLTKDDNKIKVSIKMPELSLLAKMNSSHNLKKLLHDIQLNVTKVHELFIQKIE